MTAPHGLPHHQKICPPALEQGPAVLARLRLDSGLAQQARDEVRVVPVERAHAVAIRTIHERLFFVGGSQLRHLARVRHLAGGIAEGIFSVGGTSLVFVSVIMRLVLKLK